MRLLVFMLLFYHVLAKDLSKVEKVDVCPDNGYYFKRESNPNAVEQSCQLCFCQNNGTAVCWLRDNKRCDKNNYYHFAKKRQRRSFSDIFFRDAARDILNKQLPADQCKPYESSYSEGCPPADWCIGCTICDCDANGRWDCHTLSFCPDEKGKKQVKKKKFGSKNKVTKNQLPTKITTPNTVKKTTKKPGKYVQKYQNQKQVNKHMEKNQKQINMKNKKARESQKKKVTAKKAKPLQKKSVPARRQAITKNNTQQNKPNKAKELNPAFSKTDPTAIFAESILKKVMASVEKFLNESQKNINKSNTKALQKRSMSKQVSTNKTKTRTVQTNMTKSKTGKVDKKHWMKKVLVNKKNEKLGMHRRKRELVVSGYFKNNIATDNKSFAKPTLKEVTGSDRQAQSRSALEDMNTLNKLNYFSYFIDTKNYRNADNLTTIAIPTFASTEKLVENKQIDSSSAINEQTKTVSTINTTINTKNNKQKQDNTELDQEVGNTVQNFTGFYTDMYNETCGRMCELRKYLKSFFFKNAKNSTKHQKKDQKTNILKKMKIFFNKLFHIAQPKAKKLDDPRYPFRKRSIIRTICKNITSCEYNLTDKILCSKLNQLKVESEKIIKSVKIIKGLLKLLDSYAIGDKFRNLNERVLAAILNDEYEASLVNITETQQVQIYYIKENTNIFIRSMENFANTLNDLADYLTLSENVKKMKPRRIYRFARKPNKVNRHYTVSQKLDRLKKLLFRYNLVQNKFMKQMYDVISTLESSSYTTNVNKTTKVSLNTGNSDDGMAVEINMKNIINNLRKLKDLAQKLSSRNRTKRSAMGDNDAIEYLLTIMEYILKQNRPLNVPPVNDGIDLIIEAIKNAPDNKSVKKKVLDFTIETNTSERTESLNGKRQENEYKSNISQVHTFRTFESLDNESLKLNDDKHNDNLIKKDDITPEPHTIDDNDDKNRKVKTAKEMLESKHKIEKFDIFVDDDTEDGASETTSNVMETVYTSTNEITEKVPTRTMRPLDAKSDEKTYWIEDTYNNDRHQKLETTSEKTLKVTRTLKHMDKYAIHNGSDEDIEKTKVQRSEEMIKRQMSLFSTLDYETEKSLFESESTEDKHNFETFPFYFV